LDISKIAEGEWCAHKDPAERRIIRTIRAPENPYFKEVSPFALWGEYIIQNESP